MNKNEITAWDLNPIPYVRKYIDVILDVDALWEPFLGYVKTFIPNRDENFFAYNRAAECADMWRGMLDNMGGGLPVSFYASAAFLLLRYKELGFNLDTELERIHGRKTEIKCPKCGSSRLAPILYGMPCMDDELKLQIENEEVFIGGCKLPVMGPEYHCFNCGEDVLEKVFDGGI